MENETKLNTLMDTLHTEHTRHLTALIRQQIQTNPDYSFEEALLLCESQAEQDQNFHSSTRGSTSKVMSTALTDQDSEWVAYLTMKYPTAMAFYTQQRRKPDYNVGDALWGILDKKRNPSVIVLACDTFWHDYSLCQSSFLNLSRPVL